MGLDAVPTSLRTNLLSTPTAAALPPSTPPASPGSSYPHARSAHPFAHSSFPESVPRESPSLQTFDRHKPRQSHTPAVPLSASPHLSRPHPAARAIRNRRPS